jgi:hypothetical protein
MPNLEPRYLDTDKEHDAWIFGLMDALDFFESARGTKDMTQDKYIQTLTYLSKDIADSYESKLERDFGIDLSGSTLPLSTRSRDADGKTTEDLISGSARAGEDTRGAGVIRASGSIQPERQQRDTDTNAGCQCKNGVDRHYRTLRDTSVSERTSNRFIEWLESEEAGETIFGTRRRGYPTDNRSS